MHKLARSRVLSHENGGLNPADYVLHPEDQEDVALYSQNPLQQFPIAGLIPQQYPQYDSRQAIPRPAQPTPGSMPNIYAGQGNIMLIVGQIVLTLMFNLLLIKLKPQSQIHDFFSKPMAPAIPYQLSRVIPRYHRRVKDQTFIKSMVNTKMKTKMTEKMRKVYVFVYRREYEYVS